MECTAIIRKTEDGWYAAKCAQIPEAITQGRTLEEVKENLVDAIELVLQMKKANNNILTFKEYIGTINFSLAPSLHPLSPLSKANAGDC